MLNSSSMAAHMRFPLIGWSGYDSSKLASTRMFENLRFEHPDVRFVNIHPGTSNLTVTPALGHLLLLEE